MKRILLLVCMFFAALGIVYAQDYITVTSNNALWTSNDGSYTSGTVWTSSVTGKPVLTITGKSAKNVQAWNQSNGILMCRNNNSDGGRVTLTLSIASGYVITGFRLIGATAWGSSTPVTFSSNGKSASGASGVTLEVDNLNTTSTQISVTESANNDRAKITDFVVYYDNANRLKLIDFFKNKRGYVFGVPADFDYENGTGDLETAVRTAVNTPNVTNYEAALSAFEGYENKVQPVDGGYYRIISAYPGFANEMAIYHSSDNVFKWKTLDKENATFVFRFVQDGDKWKIYNVYSERYLKNNDGELTDDAATATSYTFVDQGLAVQNIYNGSGSGTGAGSGNIHAYNHGNGANSSGTLCAGAGGASAWYIVPVDNIEDVKMIEPNAVDEGETVHQSFAHSAKVLVVNGGVGVYKVTGVADGKAIMASVSSRVIPANKGVVLSGEKGKKVSLLTVSTDVGTDYDDNKLEQGHNSEEDYSGNYVLAYKAEDTEAHFYKIGTLVIPTNRAYLPSTAVTSNVKALSLSFDDDEVTTGVEADEMKQPEDNAVVYDLQGRRVTRLQRGGLYIVGGKKVIVK